MLTVESVIGSMDRVMGARSVHSLTEIPYLVFRYEKTAKYCACKAKSRPYFFTIGAQGCKKEFKNLKSRLLEIIELEPRLHLTKDVTENDYYQKWPYAVRMKFVYLAKKNNHMIEDLNFTDLRFLIPSQTGFAPIEKTNNQFSYSWSHLKKIELEINSNF